MLNRLLRSISIFTLTLYGGFIALQPMVAHAISANELKSIVTDTTFYDPDSDICTPSSTTAGTGSVFYIGDSLTYHMVKGSSDPAKYTQFSGMLLEKTKAAGYSVDTTIPPVGGTDSTENMPRIVGKSVEAQGGVNVEGSIRHIKEHTADYATANIIVIGLGTNTEQLDFRTQIDALITEIRANNQNASIFWVNTYYTAPTKNSYQDKNKVIAEASQNGTKFTVIDYATAASKDPTIAPEPYVSGGADGVHVGTGAGRQKKADWLLNQLPKSSSNGALNSDGIPSLDINSITWNSGVWGDGSTKFSSGNQGPYTLEYWAISVLKNIARKSGVSESTIVTPAKVLALIVFAKTEGGGVSGHNGTYNPLNRKGTYSDIQGGNQGNASNDTNSEGYTTFDDGVEAVTRGLFGSYQKRIGASLLQPGISPEQFLEAVTGNFYMEGGPSNNIANLRNGWEDRFPGDKAWAAGSITDWIYSPADYAIDKSVGIGNHDDHLKSKLNTLNYVKNNYSKVAGVLLDFPGRKADTRPAPPLTYTDAEMAGIVSTVGKGCGASASTISGTFELGAYTNTKIRYDSKPNMTYPGCNFDGTQPKEAVKGEQPGAKKIQAIVDQKWGGGTGYIFNCRGMSTDPTVPSLHGTGRAVDSMFYARNPDGLTKGNEAMGWLIANAEVIGIQYVKFWRVQWTPSKGVSCVKDASDQANHATHIHFELNWDGALMKTPHFNGQPAGDDKVAVNQAICPEL